MYEQLTLFQPPAPPARAVYGSGVGQVPALPGRRDSTHMEAIYLDCLLPLEEYDKIIVLFSGGKDSLAWLRNSPYRFVSGSAENYAGREISSPSGRIRFAGFRPEK